MEEPVYLSLKELAKACRIELEAIRQYEEFGLFPVMPAAGPDRFHEAEVRHLQMLHRLHRDLDINLEGIEVIVHMRRQVEQMQQQLAHLEHNLGFYRHYYSRHWHQADDQ